MENTKENNYIVYVICSNCDYGGDKSIPRGSKLSEKKTCPNCGCDTLNKDRDPRPIW